MNYVNNGTNNITNLIFFKHIKENNETKSLLKFLGFLMKNRLITLNHLDCIGMINF